MLKAKKAEFCESNSLDESAVIQEINGLGFSEECALSEDEPSNLRALFEGQSTMLLSPAQQPLTPHGYLYS